MNIRGNLLRASGGSVNVDPEGLIETQGVVIHVEDLEILSLGWDADLRYWQMVCLLEIVCLERRSPIVLIVFLSIIRQRHAGVWQMSPENMA